MKKIAMTSLLLACAMTTTLVYAKVSKETEAPVTDKTVAAQATDVVADKAVVSKPVPMDPKKEEALMKAIEKKRAELSNSQWEVTLTPRDSKEKPFTDVFTFKNDEISSENLTKRGFNSTNYTVSIPYENEDKAKFETMQSGKEGYVFIRGEWTKDGVTGAIHEQLDGGKKVQEYYFTSAKRSVLADEKKAEDKSGSVSKNEPAVTEKALVSKETEKKSSKK